MKKIAENFLSEQQHLRMVTQFVRDFLWKKMEEVSRLDSCLFEVGRVRPGGFWAKKKALTQMCSAFEKKRQRPTLPDLRPVPSAQRGLTSLFGMGRGGTPSQ